MPLLHIRLLNNEYIVNIALFFGIREYTYTKWRDVTQLVSECTSYPPHCHLTEFISLYTWMTQMTPTNIKTSVTHMIIPISCVTHVNMFVCHHNYCTLLLDFWDSYLYIHPLAFWFYEFLLATTMKRHSTLSATKYWCM